MNRPAKIFGHFIKVVSKAGQLSALFKNKKGDMYYLFLPELEKEVGNEIFQRAYAKYQNYLNWNTYLEIQVTFEVGKTATGIPKMEAVDIREYKKEKNASEQMIEKVYLSAQAIEQAKGFALELEKMEIEEKNYLCMIVQISPNHANYCREDLGGKRNYYFSINYEKEEIKKFQADSKQDLFKQVFEFSAEQRRRSLNSE